MASASLPSMPSIVMMSDPSTVDIGVMQTAARRAVHVDGAGAALGNAAAIFRAGEFLEIANDPKQRGLGVPVESPFLSIEFEGDHVRVPHLAAHVGRAGLSWSVLSVQAASNMVGVRRGVKTRFCYQNQKAPRQLEIIFGRLSGALVTVRLNCIGPHKFPLSRRRT